MNSQFDRDSSSNADSAGAHAHAFRGGLAELSGVGQPLAGRDWLTAQHRFQKAETASNVMARTHDVTHTTPKGWNTHNTSFGRSQSEAKSAQKIVKESAILHFGQYWVAGLNQWLLRAGP